MITTEMKLNDYLDQEFTCTCGHVHRTSLKTIHMKENALENFAQLVKDAGYRNLLLVADLNTKAYLCDNFFYSLRENEITYKLHLFKQEEVHPDESAVGGVLMSYHKGMDLIVAIGSGSINDICRFTSYQLNIPYYFVATAPSMDGYASTVAAMTTNNMKITYQAHTPEVIIADLNILAYAPVSMIGAGFGDIIGKYTCLVDWKLSSLVTGEYYCHQVVELVKKARRLTVDCKEYLKAKETKAIAQLTEALILSGICMGFTDNSRPASGSEHHLSHFWEMKYLAEGKKAIFHGTKVGIGTIISLKLYELLRTYRPDFTKIKLRELPLMDAFWEAEMHRAFGHAAEEVIELERKVGKNSYKNWNRRIQTIETYWEDIISIASELPSASEVEGYLTMVGCPIRPQQIGLDQQTVIDSIYYAKEVRDRYTILQLLWDLGLLEDFTSQVIDYLF